MKKYIVGSIALLLMFVEASTVLASPFGQHLTRNVSTDFSDILAFALSLRIAPEPGSLFILGTVLFSLALFVFWKAAKSSKQY